MSADDDSWGGAQSHGKPRVANVRYAPIADMRGRSVSWTPVTIAKGEDHGRLPTAG